MNQSNKLYNVFENDTVLNVIEGLTYEIKAYIAFKQGTFEPSQLDNASFFFLPQGYIKSECTVTPFELVEDNLYPNTENPTFDDWKPTITTFVAKADASLQLTFHHELKTNINVSTGMFFLMDDITFKGPYDFISESQTLKNQCSCNYQGVTLRWLNDLGGWESWYFFREAVYSENVTNKIDIKRDKTQDFDNYYINGETEFDNIKTDVGQSILVRSQLLTKNEQRVLQQIRRSIRVQILMDSGKWQTVTTPQGSFVIDDEGDKTRSISFNIKLPNLTIQEQ